MSKPVWTPWHKVVKLRSDLKTGELSLAIFAADLYDVVMGKAKKVYQDPKEFFALTYPTFNLRELAKDVAQRLAGKNDKAVRQLELTYGGGKTHTLITLYHLVNEPNNLPDLPAVAEFTQHIGMIPPQARVAALCFDKLDVEKGMEVRAPDGKTRWLKNPWSVMAFQLAGAEGLKLLSPDGKDKERDSAPAENLLVELLSLPRKEDLSTLILIDEVLMFAREKVGLDAAWRSRLLNFFQYLTQAATKVERCAVVASLLATDPHKSDTLGKEITQELYTIFRREREEGVQPVLKEDVAEVLRRRFFTPESTRDPQAFRQHVVAALKGVCDLDEQTRKDGKIAEDRFLKSYPFHPDLTEILYSKWTNLEGFQRTRGILRTFALALRDAEKWDESPVVSANVFLQDAKKGGISEAARELTTIAATEEYEGKKQEWTGILEGELEKAREIELETGSLKQRELEQAVFCTFLHSQPVGQKALTRELMVLIGASRPDKIELEKGLRRWADVSWFLDEAALSDADAVPGGLRQLPKAWRLGSKPNLRQMHHDACLRVSPELADAKLLDEIGKLKSLTAGAGGAGAKVHNLPDKPREIEDDGEFHYAVLGPRTASDSGKPSADARRYIDETTAADKPRVFRNAIILAVPSRDGLEIARTRVREYLGWEEVRAQLKGQEMDPNRIGHLSTSVEIARKRIPDAIQQAYCIVVSVSDKNDVQAFKATVGGDTLFNVIKADSRSRIQEAAVSADALLPGGPYDLWRAGETSRRVKDLVGAFAQFPHLPKMLNRRAILETLLLGCRDGQFILKTTRPDRSAKTIWRREPEEADLKDPALEVVLPESAVITELSSKLLVPGTLPELWQMPEITVQEVHSYFSGGKVVKIQRDNYPEPVTIPKADGKVVDAAIHQAVKDGDLWLISGPASILAEEIPTGLLTSDAQLQAPPQAIPATDVLPANLPDGWSADNSTALAISVALSKKSGKPLPWKTIQDAIDAALRARLIERTLQSGPWPCDYAGAQTIKLRLPKTPVPVQITPPAKTPGVMAAEAELKPNQIQDFADQVSEISKAAVGLDVKFRLRIELSGSAVTEATKAKINNLLKDVSEDLKLS